MLARSRSSCMREDLKRQRSKREEEKIKVRKKGKRRDGTAIVKCGVHSRVLERVFQAGSGLTAVVSQASHDDGPIFGEAPRAIGYSRRQIPLGEGSRVAHAWRGTAPRCRGSFGVIDPASASQVGYNLQACSLVVLFRICDLLPQVRGAPGVLQCGAAQLTRGSDLLASKLLRSDHAVCASRVTSTA